MLDLTQPTSLGSGHLTKIGITSDGTGSNVPLYDLRLVFEVAQPAEADAVDGVLRGARSFFDSLYGVEETGAFSRSPDGMSGQFELTYVSDGSVVVDATGEVHKLELVKARKGFQYVVAVRFRGLDALVASYFVRHLNRVLMVKWTAPTTTQVAMPFAISTPNAVQVVAVETDDPAIPFRFGVQTGVDGGSILLDDFGRTFEAPVSRVSSKLLVSPPNGAPMYQFVQPFADRVRAAGGVPSWKWLVLTIGQQAFDGTGSPSAVYTLGDRELDAAANLAISEVIQ